MTLPTGKEGKQLIDLNRLALAGGAGDVLSKMDLLSLYLYQKRGPKTIEKAKQDALGSLAMLEQVQQRVSHAVGGEQ